MPDLEALWDLLKTLDQGEILYAGKTNCLRLGLGKRRRRRLASVSTRNWDPDLRPPDLELDLLDAEGARVACLKIDRLGDWRIEFPATADRPTLILP